MVEDPRERSLGDAWFDTEPRVSRTSVFSVPPPPVLPSRARTVLAGVLAGGLAAGAGTVVAREIGRSKGVDVVDVLGHLVARGVLSTMPSLVRGFGLAIALGVAIAIPIVLVTRHVQRAFAIGLFGAIFAPIVWLAVHVWVHAPLPLVPMLAGCASYGALLAIAVPIRGR